MFQIKKGTSRRVIIICNKIVLKFPHPFAFLWMGGHKNLSRAYFWKAIVSNVTESMTCFLNRKVQFLVPVYVTFGFVNIQKCEVGRHPTDTELRALLRSLSPEAQEDSKRVNGHHIKETNFIVNDSGWHVIDYGENWGADEVSFSWFLLKYREELEKAFSPLNTL